VVVVDRPVGGFSWCSQWSLDLFEVGVAFWGHPQVFEPVVSGQLVFSGMVEADHPKEEHPQRVAVGTTAMCPSRILQTSSYRPYPMCRPSESPVTKQASRALPVTVLNGDYRCVRELSTSSRGNDSVVRPKLTASGGQQVLGFLQSRAVAGPFGQ
jgi:hypothetical protein